MIFEGEYFNFSVPYGKLLKEAIAVEFYELSVGFDGVVIRMC